MRPWRDWLTHVFLAVSSVVMNLRLIVENYMKVGIIGVKMEKFHSKVYHVLTHGNRNLVWCFDMHSVP